MGGELTPAFGGDGDEPLPSDHAGTASNVRVGECGNPPIRPHMFGGESSTGEALCVTRGGHQLVGDEG